MNTSAGNLGNGQTGSGVASPAVPVSGLSNARSVVVAYPTDYCCGIGDAAGLFACALVEGGKVKCWGDNTMGTLGNGTFASSPVPVEVSGISGATAIALGESYACALLASGGVSCWGTPPMPISSCSAAQSACPQPTPIPVPGFP